MSDEIKNNPVIRISIAGTVGDKCQMSFETYADAAAPTKFLDALADKLMAVRDRQVAYYEIQDLKRLYQAETNQLEALKDDLIRVDKMHQDAKINSEKKGIRVAKELTPKEKQERLHITTNIQVRTKRLEDMLKDIEKREKLVGDRN